MTYSKNDSTMRRQIMCSLNENSIHTIHAKTLSIFSITAKVQTNKIVNRLFQLCTPDPNVHNMYV